MKFVIERENYLSVINQILINTFGVVKCNSVEDDKLLETVSRYISAKHDISRTINESLKEQNK